MSGSYTTKPGLSSIVRSIQRGLVDGTGSVTIVSVDTSKATLQITTIRASTGNERVAMITSSTTISVTDTSGNSASGNFAWEVIEYV